MEDDSDEHRNRHGQVVESEGDDDSVEDDDDDSEEDDDDYSDDDDDEDYMPLEESKAFCRRIKSNDPTITAINDYDDEDFHQNGKEIRYSSDLGQSLLHNSVISKIYVHVRDVVNSSEFQAVQTSPTTVAATSPLLAYLRTNKCLREVDLSAFNCNTPAQKSTCVADAIFRAIAASASIHDFSFGPDVKVSPESWDCLLRTSQSIRSLTVMVDQYANDPASWPIVGHAFGSNHLLEELSFYAYNGRADIAEHILTHLESHPALKRLTLQMGIDATPTHFDAMARLIRTTRSLQSLDVTRYSFTERQMAEFVAALNSNPKLIKLFVMTPSRNQDMLLVRSIPLLRHVRNLTAGDFRSNSRGWLGLAAAIRANGSIRRFNFYQADPTRRQKRIMRAARMRNKNLGRLLAKPDLPSIANHPNDESDDKTSVPLFPPLFQSGCQAPQMAFTSVLTGLLALEGDDSIGHS